MEYSDIFIPVSEYLQKMQLPLSQQQLGNRIKFGVKGFEWEWLQDFKIGLIGLRTAGVPHCFSFLREALYALYMPSRKINVIDLGDIELTGGSVEENAEKTACGLQQIFAQNVLPLVFAENMCYSYWLYSALKIRYAGISASYILPSANVGNPHEELTENNMLGHSLIDLTRELSHLSILGYQNYLTNTRDVHWLEKNYCEPLRLNRVRDNMQNIEPILRDATLLCASVNAIRQSDAPAASRPSPNGLYTEEICRLLRDAAVSSELKACFVGGFNFASDFHSQTAMLVAQMLWHVIEGAANRVKEHPINSKTNIRSVHVEMGGSEHNITFYQGKITQRWWMEIPSTAPDLPKRIIACSQNDYDQAVHGEIPDRWLWFFKKFAS